MAREIGDRFKNMTVRIERHENEIPREIIPLPSLDSRNTQQAVIICVYACVCSTQKAALEAPPFHQPVIYRFKKHLTIDYKAFPSPSPAEAENKAPMIERQAEQSELNPKTSCQFFLKQKIFLSAGTNYNDMKRNLKMKKYLLVRGRHYYC